MELSLEELLARVDKLRSLDENSEEYKTEHKSLDDLLNAFNKDILDKKETV
jgi:hypothetical protein